jgi:hypothetical protein
MTPAPLRRVDPAEHLGPARRARAVKIDRVIPIIRLTNNG